MEGEHTRNGIIHDVINAIKRNPKAAIGTGVVALASLTGIGLYKNSADNYKELSATHANLTENHGVLELGHTALTTNQNTLLNNQKNTANYLEGFNQSLQGIKGAPAANELVSDILTAYGNSINTVAQNLSAGDNYDALTVVIDGSTLKIGNNETVTAAEELAKDLGITLSDYSRNITEDNSTKTLTKEFSVGIPVDHDGTVFIGDATIW